MAKSSLPSIDDIDDDVLNSALLQGAKNMPSLSVKKTARAYCCAKACSSTTASRGS